MGDAEGSRQGAIERSGSSSRDRGSAAAAIAHGGAPARQEPPSTAPRHAPIRDASIEVAEPVGPRHWGRAGDRDREAGGCSSRSDRRPLFPCPDTAADFTFTPSGKFCWGRGGPSEARGWMDHNAGTASMEEAGDLVGCSNGAIECRNLCVSYLCNGRAPRLERRCRGRSKGRTGRAPRAMAPSRSSRSYRRLLLWIRPRRPRNPLQWVETNFYSDMPGRMGDRAPVGGARK